MQYSNHNIDSLPQTHRPHAQIDSFPFQENKHHPLIHGNSYGSKIRRRIHPSPRLPRQKDGEQGMQVSRYEKRRDYCAKEIFENEDLDQRNRAGRDEDVRRNLRSRL